MFYFANFDTYLMEKSIYWNKIKIVHNYSFNIVK